MKFQKAAYLSGFPLWDFSLRIYAQPGVSAAAIALQDQYGLDVNLLLLCLWCGVEGPGALDAATFGRCRDAVDEWQRTVVAPLRELRRRLKTGSDVHEEQRDRVAAEELAAEHAEQRLLAELLSDSGTKRSLAASSQIAAANLRAYCNCAGVSVSAAIDEQLGVLVDALARLP